MSVQENWIAGRDLEVFDFECGPHWHWYFGEKDGVFIRHCESSLPEFKAVAEMRGERWVENEVVEMAKPPVKEPGLCAEVHNPTKIDPETAMAAVRSLCG